mmetsp:Transcript_36655/g.84529  ORF Transcript_36655/g.84529 Transcript_36655/m.84529 type:complete len:160 (-) Transcript_36655:80-559(-)
MGCAQSQSSSAAPTPHHFPTPISEKRSEADSVTDGGNVLKVEDLSLHECEEPIGEDYDSWRHMATEYDYKLVRQGHGVPIERSTHLRKAAETESMIREILKDPAKLQSAVKARRMSSREIQAYKQLMAQELSGGQKVPKPSPKQEVEANNRHVRVVHSI